MIQGVVTRMGTNSFLLKGWGVILVAGLLALAANSDEDTLILVVACFPIIAFWCLDGYYLKKERQFRDLYNHVRQNEPSVLDYDLDIGISEEAQKQTWMRAVISPTLLAFYGGMLATIVVVIIVTIHGGG